MMTKNEQGIFRERYQLIPRTLIFITRGETVLMIKGAPTKRLWANRYNGVGGHIERGEDVLSAARRELMEETGLAVENLTLCGVVTVDSGEDVGIGIYVLRGECLHGNPRPSPEGTLEWVPIDCLNEYPLVEDLPALLPRVLSMQPGEAPFVAQYSYNSQEQLIIRFG